MIPSASTLSLLFLKILDTFFPRECLLCSATGDDLCQKCIATLSWPKPKRRKLQWMTAIWNYRDEQVRQIVVTIKNKSHTRLAALCAHHFIAQIKNLPQTPTDWILIPIPISKSRRRKRGYNQSELLAIAYQRALHARCTRSTPTSSSLPQHFPVYKNALVKKRTTLKQGTTESREERIENMRNVFAVTNPTPIIGKKIILIDDVTTTGATLADAKRALLEAGALKVLAWTIAN